MDYFLSVISLVTIAFGAVEIYRARKEKRETGIAPERSTPEGSVIFLGIVLLVLIYGALAGLQFWVTAIFGPLIVAAFLYSVWRLISAKRLPSKR